MKKKEIQIYLSDQFAVPGQDQFHLSDKKTSGQGGHDVPGKSVIEDKKKKKKSRILVSYM